MKRETWISVLWAFLLSFAAMFGGLGCVYSGFALWADVGILALGCAGICLLFALMAPWKLKWILPVLLGLMGILWWREGTLQLSLLALLHRISVGYDLGYGWGVIPFPGERLWETDLIPSLLLVGTPVALAVSWTIVRGRLGFLGAGVALIPLFSCLVLTDTPPDGVYAALLFAAILLILLTEGVRRRSAMRGNRLTALLALPVALAVAALFLLVPKGGYQGQEGAQKLEDWVLSFFQEQPQNQPQVPVPSGPVMVQGDQKTEVALQSVGNLIQTSRVVMTVRAQESGLLYLRGTVYDHYDGLNWTTDPGWDNRDLEFSVIGDVKALEIETREVHSVRYFTYGPYALPNNVVGGQLPNTGNYKTYTLRYRSLRAYDASWDTLGSGAIIGPEKDLQLPAGTRGRAQRLLTQISGMVENPQFAGQIYRNAEAICRWVRSSARYNLRTDPMPGGEADFALWFLEKSETGYCTHFASAAVVLLRAAGIPARYVTGYTVEAKAGDAVNVTMREAHAWVEVHIAGVGWVVMDPTPGTNEGIQETEPTETEEPDPTQTTGDQELPTNPTESKPVPTTALEVLPKPTLGRPGGEEKPGTEDPEASKVLLRLLWVLLAAAGLVLQWRLRVQLRVRWLETGETNRRALRYWRHLCLLGKLSGTEPQRQLYELARKARFSQHTLTPEELEQLAAACGEYRKTLRQGSFGRQLLYRLIFALY